MHIKITNFHNISSLDYDIVDGKVNFLYGVSGSGKSSIVKGATQIIDREVDVMVGRSPDYDTAVLINGKPGPLESTATFDRNRQTALFSSSPDRSFYDIFIGNEDELDALRGRYGVALTSLRDKTSDLLRIKNEVETLAKTLGKTSRGKFTAASKMGKAIKTYDVASKSTSGYIERRGMNAAVWVKAGFDVDDTYANGLCPFCGQELESSPEKEALAELRALSVKDLKPLFDSSEQLATLGQAPIDISTAEGRNRAEELVNALPKVSAEVDRIIRYCNIGADYKTVRTVEVEALNPDPSIYTFMPELSEVVDTVNARAAELKDLIAKMKAAFNKLVRSGCNELNRKLMQFGIPYTFELTAANSDEKTASYCLVHVDADTPSDMRESLSFGERNLITLILFLQDKEWEVMMIDDPASSYDDYRRTQIFKTIMEVQGKTLLVVSHDQAFVRRAVRVHNDRMGNVDMLCNRLGRASVEPITKESFGYFESIIRRQIASASTYYQRMLNVRLLCEVHGAGTADKALWGYVSAILHHTGKNEVLALLEKDNTTEDAMLARIKQLVGNEAAPSIVAIPEEVDYATDGFSEFERLIALREEIKAPGGGSLLPKGITKGLAIGLLDDLVHMNDAMIDCIDPYRYPVWSPILFKLLES